MIKIKLNELILSILIKKIKRINSILLILIFKNTINSIFYVYSTKIVLVLILVYILSLL